MSGEEDFITYGNALEPLDEENLPRKKPVTIEEQFAYDAQGRKRFHGAFTGGFSAGYFNTVGSRDGWRPQQFKSTRSSKADNVVQRPEDFMDDEDTGEFGIAPTAIRATQEYTTETKRGTKRERMKNETAGPIPGTPVLKDLLKPVHDRVGVMLLKKMGWKPGQGVGPRITKKEKQKKLQYQQKIKIYGCSLPNQQNIKSDSESGSSDDEYANITFVPDDYEPYRCNPKDNYFGIGYSGLDRRPVLTEHFNLFDAPSFSMQDKNKKLSIKGQAFGVGAFEDEDDDIYAKDDMTRYDFTLGPERQSKSRWSKEIKSKPSCIDGFVPAKEQLAHKKIFCAPVLPKDFQPIHKIRKSRFSPLTETVGENKKRYEMNADSRAKIINDDKPSFIESKKMDSRNSSIAAKLISRTLNLYGKEQTLERQKLDHSQIKKSAMSWLDKLSSTTFVKGEIVGNDPKIQGNLQAVNTFLKESNKMEKNQEVLLVRPSFADLDKQQRFEQYLKFSVSERKLKFPSIQPLSMIDWEREQEIDEFEKASKLCQSIDKVPMTELNNEDEVNELDMKVDFENLSLEDRMTAAAKMKKFGKLTRIDVEWKPVKLVCVRFNIAEPSIGVATAEKKKKKFSIFDSMAWNDISKFDVGKHLEHEVEPRPSTSSTSFGYSFTSVEHKSKTEQLIDENASDEKLEIMTEKEKAFEKSYQKVFKRDINKTEDSEIFKSKTDESTNHEKTEKIVVEEKKDLYKSIFLSSSEDSESDTEKTETMDDEKLKAALIGKSAVEFNVQRNTSPPRGIFAKLDLDSLLKQPEKIVAGEPSEFLNEFSYKIDNVSVDKHDIEIKIEQQDVSTDAYGPALPKDHSQLIDAASQKPIYTGLSKKIVELKDGQWVEKSREKKKSKKEKKKHKHKERSRSKSKKKSKKEKKH